MLWSPVWSACPRCPASATAAPPPGRRSCRQPSARPASPGCSPPCSCCPSHTDLHTRHVRPSWRQDSKHSKSGGGTLTGVQQQFHHGEVWMGNAVVERHVPVAVRQVHHVRQQSGRGQTHLSQVGSDGVGLGVLLTGHPEPLLVEGHQDLTLWRRDEGVTVKAKLVSSFYRSLNIFAIVSLNSSHLNNCSSF